MQNELITMPKFNNNEFPMENSEFLLKLEDLEKKINLKLEVYKSANLEEMSIQDIKEDRASLNKLIKFLKEGKKAMKDAWAERLSPYENKLFNMLQKIEYIEKSYGDKIKLQEEIDKKYKREAIEKIFNSKNPFGKILSFESILESEWLNKSYNLSKIELEIDELFCKLKDALYVIDKEEMSEGLKKTCKIKLFETLSLEEALKETYSFAEKLSFLDEMTYMTKTNEIIKN